jgi:hypothetical protein
MYKYSARDKKVIKEYLESLNHNNKDSYLKGKLTQALIKGRNVLPICNCNLDQSIKCEMLAAMESNIDYDILLKYGNNSAQHMHEIRLCLEMGIIETDIPITRHWTVIRSFRLGKQIGLLNDILK